MPLNLAIDSAVFISFNPAIVALTMFLGLFEPVDLALGLKKRESVVIKEDNAQIRGMINKVSHLVEVTEIAE